MDATRRRESVEYEFVVRSDGQLELRDPASPERWLSTDRPVEIVR